jgi:hypothetical protein
MPRKRTLPPELQEQDRVIAAGAAGVLQALSVRYPLAGLNVAASIVYTFTQTEAEAPRRAPKRKAQTPPQATSNAYESTLVTRAEMLTP